MSSTMTDFMTWSNDFSLQASRLDLRQRGAGRVSAMLLRRGRYQTSICQQRLQH